MLILIFHYYDSKGENYDDKAEVCLKAEIVGGHNGQNCLSREEEDNVFEAAAKVFLVWIPRLNK